ncbi:hypothetical protein [Allosphingosinicella deserti]|nr:hypothetical protein [Sphingomonas deserti]
MITRFILLIVSAALLWVGSARAQTGAFDLAGPQLRATVTRGTETLPIGRVPQLQAGDRIHVEAELPADRSGKHLLVIAFLRDAASPPPKKWFERLTLTSKARALTATVPEGAKQAIVLLAPEVGGGFGAIVSAVRGRPGVFVRAARDLGQASLDRARLETFLDGVNAADVSSPQSVETISPILARSLAIRLSAECLQREPALQAACLTQSREALILNDGRKPTLAETLTGAPVDLAYRVSATPEAGAGYYSPYIGVVRDVARLLGAFGSAEYQYIPALALGRNEGLRLLLNTAPSFRKPHSVMVVPLPPVEPPEPPAFRPAAGQAITCLNRPNLTLPIEGAPILYATDFAHDLHLDVRTAAGETLRFPLRADPRQGGLVLAGTAAPPLGHQIVQARVLGRWGFEPLEGPVFHVQSMPGAAWRVTDGASPVVGRANQVALEGGTSACVEEVSYAQAGSSPVAAQWKATGPGSLAIALSLEKGRPGPIELRVKRYGSDAQRLSVTAFTEASRIERFVIHAGDRSGVLKGTRLDQVESLDWQDQLFRPGTLSRVRDIDELTLDRDPAGAAAQPGAAAASGKVRLKDGRIVPARVEVLKARPSAILAGKTIELGTSAGALTMQHVGDQALAENAVLTFSIKAQADTRFTGGEVIEVAAANLAPATLKPGAGVTLVDATTLVARFKAETLGPAAYGPLRYRVLQDGVAGEWQPLVTLVRLPVLQGLACVGDEPTCTISGSELYLIHSVSADAGFSAAALVPPGYTGTSLPIARPQGGALFLRMRDAPDISFRVAMPS